ncbi:MAG: flagellin [Nanoarchaeota archaeon]|nr:flagellin [Nanoarchaeota archaeon]
MMYSNNKKAAQGVGTLIIFIALILVAAVAAAVLISTASNLQSSAFDVGSQTNERILTSVEVVQIVASNTSDGFINATEDTYRIRMRLGAGSMPIKLDDLTVSVDTSSNSQVLTFNDSAASQSTFNVTYRTGVSQREGYLEPGQLVDVLFLAEADVGERERISFTILSTNGAPLPVSLLTPSVMIQETTTLYP